MSPPSFRNNERGLPAGEAAGSGGEAGPGTDDAALVSVRRGRRARHDLTDPAGKPVDEVRPIVDDIDRRAQALLAELLE